MSFYAELGVREDAPRDEIRTAYLRLAKEHHPDKMQTGRDREMADERMSRLNRIMDVLGHEDKRAEYDRELQRQRAAAQAAIEEALALELREVSRHGGWRTGETARLWLGGCALLTAAAVVAVLFWVKESPEPRATLQTYQEAVFVPARTNTEPRGWIRERTKAPARVAVGGGRTAAVAMADLPPVPDLPSGPPAPAISTESELVREARRALERPQQPTPALVTPPVPAVAPTLHPEVRTVAAAVPAPPSPAPRGETAVRWTGVWQYSRGPEGDGGGQFSPLSIVMRLKESGNAVHGLYKARYQVTNGKYSGDVEFLMEGRLDGRQRVRGTWEGMAGAHGEFELKKAEPGGVQMSWWTTAFGPKKALASGMARLAETSH